MSHCYFPSLVTEKGSSSYLAHAKGILAADASSGFWLVHSIPQFALPPKTTGKATEFFYPPNAKDNGQSVLCISFNSRSQLDSIASQLLVMKPNIYSSQVTPDVSIISANFVDLKNKKWSKDSEQTKQIKSSKGVSFTSFVRSPKSEHKELYLEIVAPGIGSDLLVETWRRGAGDPLPSNCTYQYKVNNIDKVELTFEDGSAFSKTSAWGYIEDHSKWAVTPESNPSVSCIGDINRMASQYKRGGGTVCLFDKTVWQAMRSSIEEVEACPRKRVQNDSKKKKKGRKNRPGDQTETTGRHRRR
jgi:deoxyribonuclease-2